MRIKSLILLLLSALPLKSYAVVCDPPGAAHTAGLNVISAITAKLTIMQTLLVETLKLMTGQLTANLQMLPGALAKMTDAQTLNLARIAQQGEESRVIRDFIPSASACQNLTLTHQLQESDRYKEKIHRQLNRKSHQQAHQLATTSGSLHEAIHYRYDYRHRHYCGEEDVSLGICQKKSVLADADVLVGETLLQQKTLINEAQQQAAFDLTHTLLKPIPNEPLRKAQLQTPAGQQAYLRQKAQEARHNLAQNVFSEVIAAREPLLNAQWMQEILNAQDQSLATPLPAKISPREFMILEVQRRYENPQWYLDVQAMEPAEVQRQLLHMMALLIKLVADQNQFLEQQAVLQATQLAILNERHVHPIPAQTISFGEKK